MVVSAEVTVMSPTGDAGRVRLCKKLQLHSVKRLSNKLVRFILIIMKMLNEITEVCTLLLKVA